MARGFISYKRNIEPDQGLAARFANLLVAAGHSVFIDTQIRPGAAWPGIIEQEIERADFFIVLLSEQAAASEMIIQEVAIASEAAKKGTRPVIMPVRLAFEGRLPYDLAARLERRQQVFWNRDGDENGLAARLLDAIAAGSWRDSKRLEAAEPLAAPLADFDPSWLEDLDSPEGSTRLESPFYIDRQSDERAKKESLRRGTITRIQGPRQVGKSSLLARIFKNARRQEYPALYVDFQRLDTSLLKDLNTLLRYLADLMHVKLKTNEGSKRYWETPLGVKDKLSDFIGSEVLANSQRPFVLLMDEVDRIFEFESYRDDFFGLLRFWHSSASTDELWENMNVVLAYSTDAAQLIVDQNQSPFNVGLEIALADFTRVEVESLNVRHGRPIPAEGMTEFRDMFGGHPYLVRKGL